MKILVRKAPKLSKEPHWDNDWNNDWAYDWDVSEYEASQGKGYILRPHPNAGGGAHPRYLNRSGFISLSPRLGLTFEEWKRSLPCTFVGEVRETQRGEKFLAIIATTSDGEPEAVLFTSRLPQVEAKEGNLITIATSSDRTASGAKKVYKGVYLATVGSLIEESDFDDPEVYRVTSQGLKVISIDEGAGADDLENLG